MVEGLITLQKIMKATSSKALVIRINLVFLACFLVIYAALLLRPSSSLYFDNAASLVRCSLRECGSHGHKAENGFKMMKVVLEESDGQNQIQPNHYVTKNMSHQDVTKIELPSFMNKILKKSIKIGMVNMDNEEDDITAWKQDRATIIPIQFKRVSKYFKWEDLFPEWIDEEEETEVPSCPELPMPDFKAYDKKIDMIVAKLPCKYPEEGWNREVLRLQVQLVVANLAVKKGKRDWKRRSKVAFLSKCRPMLELFRCDDLVKQEGDWWYYELEMSRLEQKVSFPVGSCKLSMPLWAPGMLTPFCSWLS